MLRTKRNSLLAFILFCIMILSACTPQETPDELMADVIISPEAANYDTVKASFGEYRSSVSGSAAVAYMVETSLSYKNSGAKYKEVLVRNGSVVSAGDTLMTFEVESVESEKVSLELQLQRKREDYRSGKASRQAAIDEEKLKAASLSGFDQEISQLQVEKLQIEYKQFVYKTEREISNLKKQIEQIETNLADTALYAPFDGVVSYVYSGMPGDSVTVNKVLIRIYSTDTVLLQVKTGASDLRYNMPVSLEYGKGDKMRTYTGRVVTAANIMPGDLEQNMTLIQLDQELDTKSINGAFRFTAVSEEIRDILVADKDVLNGTNDDTYVYILEDDTVHKRYISVRKNKGDTIWILDGVSDGQDIILG